MKKKSWTYKLLNLFVALTLALSSVITLVPVQPVAAVGNLTVTINAAYNLVVNYQGDAFTGDDRVTIEVCDLLAACAQGFFDIEVVGGVVVFNGLSPDGDGINDFMFIKYVDVVEGALQNKVTIFNRWGDTVFDIQNYNNADRVFTGLSNKGAELPAGTYFYKIELSGNKPLTGFITLMR